MDLVGIVPWRVLLKHSPVIVDRSSTVEDRLQQRSQKFEGGKSSCVLSMYLCSIGSILENPQRNFS